MEDFEFDLDDFDAENFDNDFLDFREVESEKKVEVKKEYKKQYDQSTVDKYKSRRECKIDPITYETIPEKVPIFEIKNIWDPITGEFSKEEDPFGPLCFDPVGLIYYFYENRYKHLYQDEQIDEDTGDRLTGFPLHLGKGENFDIKGRGEYPEYFLWRIPIIDCYLEKNADRSIPVKGPKLSRKDIVKLYELAKKCPQKHIYESFETLPNIVEIYDLYMKAIDPKPKIKPNIEKYGSEEEKRTARDKVNMDALKMLLNY